MCAIVGSFSKTKLQELFELNAYRGQLSHSLASFDTRQKLRVIMNGPGKMSDTFIRDFPEAPFYIGHSQAPTTESKNIHPAVVNGALLWHNGIVKQKEVGDGVWDTEWILKGIVEKGFEFLSEVDGTFACVLYNNGKIYIFRNEISPMFIDSDFNFSSTKFGDAKALEPNKVFEFDFKSLKEVAQFTTKENPYYFG